MRHQWDHDLGIDGYALTCNLAGGLKQGLRLHLGDFRKRDPQPAPAMSQHGICFRHQIDGSAQAFVRNVQSVCERDDLSLRLWQELVERGIEQADRHRETVHHAENLGEVLALHW